MPHDATPIRSAQSHPLATQVRQRLLGFLTPLLRTLDQQLDRRLVVTFVETLQALLIWRHRNLGLLLSELGSYLAAPGHAPAGTKRLSNLLRSKNWQANLIADYLWEQAVQQVAALLSASQEALLIGDESVLEKAESEHNPDLCSVRSSTASGIVALPRVSGSIRYSSVTCASCYAGPNAIDCSISGASCARLGTSRAASAPGAHVPSTTCAVECVKRWV